MMVRLETILFCVCLAVKLSEVTVSSFLFGGPCDVRPRYKGGIPDSPDFSTELQVPFSCRYGTFRWDYPVGHALVKFNNTRRRMKAYLSRAPEIADLEPLSWHVWSADNVFTPTSICVRERLAGRAFTIIDTIDNEVVGPFDYDNWACTTTTNKSVIILRVNAPAVMQYMGEVEYKLRRH